ncbi:MULTISPECIES: deoxyribonuclease V [unclassified Modicisalibacter]|uniref:deoxyribonuclease V n=1 Tax=unclassified Modicisalibacter TaxID=2679913 RepID=UPI001CCAF574|nr:MULTISPECIES: deoxyribonuclease V [unclassified Modicisalibacter]MBZ9560261.1 deoxyribonuclease V [Modicisalibacter sp. R2A 31.J]MBZ9576170.1 deoxyribonuclease V [Modicisalibacter sp. MOD 31.J]
MPESFHEEPFHEGRVQNAALHDWTLSPERAIALQQELAPRLERHDRIGEVEWIAGVDIGFEDDGATTRAAVVLLHWPDLTPVEELVHREPTRMPYIPGLLSFREIPAALGAFDKLSRRPDLVMVDGQGIAHPRRLGIAAHLGLWLDLPTLGVAKKRLCGRHGEVPEVRGEWTPLTDRRRAEDPADVATDADGRVVIGAMLRSRLGVKPVIVSPGHRLSLATALDWTIACLGRTKLPEPTRLADRLASRRGMR